MHSSRWVCKRSVARRKEDCVDLQISLLRSGSRKLPGNLRSLNSMSSKCLSSGVNAVTFAGNEIYQVPLGKWEFWQRQQQCHELHLSANSRRPPPPFRAFGIVESTVNFAFLQLPGNLNSHLARFKLKLSIRSEAWMAMLIYPTKSR